MTAADAALSSAPCARPVRSSLMTAADAILPFAVYVSESGAFRPPNSMTIPVDSGDGVAPVLDEIAPADRPNATVRGDPETDEDREWEEK